MRAKTSSEKRYCGALGDDVNYVNKGLGKWEESGGGLLPAAWWQFSQSNRHSTIGTRQTEYHEALPLPANDEVRCDFTFAGDGNASWYSVCRVSMVEWRLDCENCRHLTVVGLHDTGPWFGSGMSDVHSCYPTIGTLIPPGSISALGVDLFTGQVTPVTQNLALQWLPSQAPGVVGSTLGLVGPVSIFCDWARYQVSSAASFSAWQLVHLTKQIRPWDTRACYWDCCCWLVA